MKIYTGVGSRDVPHDIYEIIFKFARTMAVDSWTVFTGDAQGCDYAFYTGSSVVSEDRYKIYTANDATKNAMDIAMSFHPAWKKMGDFARRLHARNAFQVLGEDLKSPSKFLLCWTPDGCISHKERTVKTGGTGTAISIADKWRIPVFNLKREDHLERIKKKVGVL